MPRPSVARGIAVTIERGLEPVAGVIELPVLLDRRRVDPAALGVPRTVQHSGIVYAHYEY